MKLTIGLGTMLIGLVGACAEPADLAAELGDGRDAMERADADAADAALGYRAALPYGDLSPFASDGCSMFPDGTLAEPALWLHCCVTHDRAYWAGGAEAARTRADEALRACVAAMGMPGTAELMYAGVRPGGVPWAPTPWRWGFGWTYLRGYTELTPAEQALVRQRSR